jgi:DNA-binding response OmpR family regulator
MYEVYMPFIPNILSVDDDTDFSMLLGVAFKNVSILDSALSISEAKSQINKTNYDAIILDYHLPDGLSPELARWIRKEKGFSTHLAIISSNPFTQNEISALKHELCLIDILKKPVPLQTLGNFAKRLIEQLNLAVQSQILEKKLELMIKGNGQVNFTDQLKDEQSFLFQTLERLINKKKQKVNAHLLCKIHDLLSRAKSGIIPVKSSDDQVADDKIFYVLSENPAFGMDLAISGQNEFHVAIETNIYRGATLLQDAEFNPKFIVSDQKACALIEKIEIKKGYRKVKNPKELSRFMPENCQVYRT